MAVQQHTIKAKDATVITYIDNLIGGATGRVEVTMMNGKPLRAICVGRFISSKDSTGIHIGTLPEGTRTTIGHQVLYPMLASRTIRDKDGFIQVNNDGKIFVMSASKNLEYTFCIELPVVY